MSKENSKSVSIASLFLMGVVSAGTLVSCKPSEAAKIEDELGAIENQYGSAADASSAKRALLAHCEHLQQWRAEGVKKLDYDFTLALANARLFVIELQLGDEVSAESFYRDSTNYLANSALRRGLTWTGCSKQEVLQMVHIADSNIAIRWKP